MYLIVGLGNPEPEYSKTRHNMGFDTVNMIAKKYKIEFNKRDFDAIYGSGKIEQEQVILFKPQTYMNESGIAIEKIREFYKIPTENIIVIFDDIDLPEGTVKIRKKGGPGTHNGMRSVTKELNSTNFPRVRIGTGMPIFKELLVNYVIEPLNDEKYKLIGSDDYKTFRYFYEYFNCTQSNIENCWNEVKAYFQTFKEWYEDLELYHYVGYLIIYGHTITNLIAEWNDSVDKDSFVRKLKGKISGEISKCPPLDYQYNVDGSNKGKCKPILLFHNIQTIVNQNKNNLDNVKYQIGVFYKFPYHLYKIESWDVEHINSNTTNEEDDMMTQKQWLLNVYLSADKPIQSKILDYFEESNEEERKKLFHEIKNHFPQSEDWTPEEKNRIWNYTLLDSSTNRSYGNALFSGKRRVIIGKDKGVKISIPKMSKDGKLQFIEERKAESSFVPLCTKQVFMKYYSSIMSDANYWTKIDADGYLSDIKDCLSKL